MTQKQTTTHPNIPATQPRWQPEKQGTAAGRGEEAVSMNTDNLALTPSQRAKLAGDTILGRPDAYDRAYLIGAIEARIAMGGATAEELAELLEMTARWAEAQS